MTRAGIARGLARRLVLLLALIALATVCAALARFHWLLELASHFAPHYAAAALAIAAALALLRAWPAAIFALALGAWNAVVTAHGASFFDGPVADAAGTRLTVLHFNAAYGHPNPDTVADYVLANAERFDVVVLIEATSRWQGALARLKPRFPHAAQNLEDSPFGIAVLSKAPPASAAVVETPKGYRYAEVRLTPAGASRPIAIYAVHPPPPISGYMADGRNDELTYIARAVRERTGESAMVVGDFNLTPWSPHFRAFIRDSGLRPVQSSAVPRNTWPVVFGQTWFGIPIDHSFVAGMTPVAHTIGPDLGSDHLPVTLTVALP